MATTKKETKTSSPVKEEKKTVKKEEKKTVKKEEKKIIKKEEKAPVKKEEVAKTTTAKTYHIAQRSSDKKWQVKFASGEKAIKLFDTQAEAIKYAEKLAKNQEGNIAIHKKDGKLRKQKY